MRRRADVLHAIKDACSCTGWDQEIPGHAGHVLKPMCKWVCGLRVATGFGETELFGGGGGESECVVWSRAFGNKQLDSSSAHNSWRQVGQT